MSLSRFFWHCFISLVKFSYWSKFHDNIITFIRDWPEIWKLEISLSEFCIISVDWGKDVPNEFLLNAAKYQGYSLYHFWVIKGKLTGGKLTPPPPPRLGLRELSGCLYNDGSAVKKWVDSNSRLQLPDNYLQIYSYREFLGWINLMILVPWFAFEIFTIILWLKFNVSSRYKPRYF